MNDELITMTQAAKLCGVNKSTIVRRRQRGDFPQAQQKDDGTWLIPVTDLIAAGLTDKIGQPGTTDSPNEHTSATSAHTTTNTDALHQLKEENARLQAQLAMHQEMQQRDAAHHQQLIEQKDATIAALHTAIRALEAPHPHNNDTTAPKPTPEPDTTPTPRSFTTRLRRLLTNR